MVRQQTIAKDAYLVKKTRAHHQDLAKGLAQEIIPNCIDHTPGAGDETGARAAVDIAYYSTNTFTAIGRPTLHVSSKSKLSWGAALDMFNLTGNGGLSHLNSELGQGQKIFAIGNGTDVHVEIMAYNDETGEGVYLLWRCFPDSSSMVTRGVEALCDHESLCLKFYASGTDAAPVVNWFNPEGNARVACKDDKAERAVLIENTAFSVYDARGVFDEQATGVKLKEMIWKHVVKVARDERFGSTAVAQFYTNLDEVTVPGSQLKLEPYRNEPNGDITATKSGKSLSYWIGRFWQNFDKLKNFEKHTLSSGARVHWNYDITLNGVQVRDLYRRDAPADAIVQVVIDGARKGPDNPSRTVCYTTSIDETRPVRMFVSLHSRCFEGITTTKPYPGKDKAEYCALDERGVLGAGGVCLHVNRYLNHGDPHAMVEGRLSEDTLGLRGLLGKPTGIYQLKPQQTREVVLELARMSGCEIVGGVLTTAGKERFKNCVHGGIGALLTLLTPSGSGHGHHINGMQPEKDRRALHKISFSDACYVFNGGNLAPNDNKTGFSCSGDGREAVRAFVVASLLYHVCRCDPFMMYHLELINSKPSTSLVPMILGPRDDTPQEQPSGAGPSSRAEPTGGGGDFAASASAVRCDAILTMPNVQRREQQRRVRKERAGGASQAVFDMMCQMACEISGMELDIIRDTGATVAPGTVHDSLRALLASGYGFVTIEEPTTSAQSCKCRWMAYSAFQITKALKTHPTPEDGDLFSRLSSNERTRLTLIQSEAMKHGASIKEPEPSEESGREVAVEDDGPDDYNNEGPPHVQLCVPPGALYKQLAKKDAAAARVEEIEDCGTDDDDTSYEHTSGYARGTCTESANPVYTSTSVAEKSPEAQAAIAAGKRKAAVNAGFRVTAQLDDEENTVRKKPRKA